MSRTPIVVAACGLLAAAAVSLVATGRPVAPPCAAPAEASPVAAAAAQADAAEGTARTPLARDKAAAGWYAAPVGTRLRYALALRSELELRDGEGQILPEGAARSELFGELALAVVARRRDEVHVQLRVTPERLQLARGDEPDSYRRLLDAGVLLRLTGDGDILGLQFAHRGYSDDRNLARGLIAALRFVVPPTASDTWEVREDDLTGTARVRYRLSAHGGGAEVRRQLLGYEATAAGATAQGSGEVTADFSLEHGFWTDVRGTEQRTLVVEQPALVVTERWTLRAELLGVHRGAPVAAAGAEPAWKPLAPGELSEIALLQDERARRAAVAAVSLDQALAVVAELAADPEALHSPAYALALRTLADLLRFDAPAAAELGRRLAAGDVPVAGGSGAVAALGMVGDASCQDALSLVLAGAKDVALRQVAAGALAQTERPTKAALDALWRVAESEGEVDDEQLAGAALAALGALAPHAGEARAQVEALLLGFGGRPRSPGATASWLEALGQAGLERAVEIAEPLLTSGDDLVRYAAVGALRNIGSDEARRLLARAAREDAFAPVRQRAAELLAR